MTIDQHRALSLDGGSRPGVSVSLVRDFRPAQKNDASTEGAETLASSKRLLQAGKE
jgi:hypothetical protein